MAKLKMFLQHMMYAAWRVANQMKTFKYFPVILVILLSSLHLQAKSNVRLFAKSDSKQIQFAITEIQSALNEKGQRSNVNAISQIRRLKKDAYNIILLNISENDDLKLLNGFEINKIEELKSEGFIIHRNNGNSKTILILGKDDAGVMYGGLEVAEIIQVQGIDAIENQLQNPYMKLRGTKFNIPLDVRTPSYSDMGDAAQNNMAEMWSFDFWKEYIDLLAQYRYNYISLWNLHPFPSMVKVPDYPDVALADVKRSTGKFREYYDLRTQDYHSPEVINNIETIRKMTIEDKIEFWRKVMQYGQDRNIDFYILTWNIYDYGVDGKYGITDKIDNPVTTDYFRKSVKQMFLTYPYLKGIGVTSGENMGGSDSQQKAEWALATYGQGVLDAVKEMPGREITLIHRQHEVGATEIAETFEPLIEHPDVNFVFSIKYAEAHVYTCTRQTFHSDFVNTIQSREDLNTIWTLRNDDVYHFRWGDADFVREFIQNMPHEVSEGFYYGSDGWVWGREFISKTPRSPRQLEIDKHWYQWLLWGRLGYNPDISNERFRGLIQSRFPDVHASTLFDAWQAASMIYPLTTGFHWGRFDFQWYIEGCMSRPGPAQTESGFHDVNRFITLGTHPNTGNVTIPKYVQAMLDSKEIVGAGPLDISRQLHQNSDKAMRLLAGLNAEPETELAKTLQDIKTMALLGKYYAHKIHGSTNLHMYRQTENKMFQEQSVNELKMAADYWRLYVSHAKIQYINPVWLNRVGYVDWEKLTQEVDKDIEIAKMPL